MTAYANCLRDLGDLLRRDAERVVAEARAHPGDDFLRGQAFAMYSVLSLMVQQANAFGIALTDLALDGLEPDRDLI